MLTSNDKNIETDVQGYLKHFSDWNKSVAILLAEQESIEMTEAHWEVIYFVQDFYTQFKTSPAMRLLVKSMGDKYGPEKGTSRYLYTLFPKGPALQATKLAGLPKPVKCI